MMLHFAAPRSAAHSALARILRCEPASRAANDNHASPEADLMLHAALRHFARHGLGAAREARREAERAFFAGERETYDWWLGICRTLDARIARLLEDSTAAARNVPRPISDGSA